MRPVKRLAAAFSVALTLGACGIPREDKPRVVPDRDVPFNLLDRAPPQTVAKP